MKFDSFLLETWLNYDISRNARVTVIELKWGTII